MPRLTVSERVRARVRKLLDDAGHGVATDIVAFSAKRPGGSHINAQQLSYLRHGTRKHPLQLDHLDDVAAFFRVSIGDLLGVSRPTDLTGTEQRVIHAFRALPDETQEHFLALIESASMDHRPPKSLMSDKGRQKRVKKPHIKNTQSGQALGDPLSASSSVDLAVIRDTITRISVELGTVAAHLPDTEITDPRTQEPLSG